METRNESKNTKVITTYMPELTVIQSELKAPKNQHNNFGNFNYRSAEDILEALKPILKKHNCNIVITDSIKQVGDRYYVKAKVTLTNNTGQTVESIAYAREEENKKGMDMSQTTGSCSSYARKYALNGMFAIDDNKDSDALPGETKQPKPTMAQPKVQPKPTQPTQPTQANPQLATPAQIQYIQGLGYKGDTSKILKSQVNDIITELKK